MGIIKAAQLRDEISLDMDKTFLEAYTTETAPRGRAFEDMVIDGMEELLALGVRTQTAVYAVIDKFPGQMEEVQDTIAEEFKFIPLSEVYN